MLWRKSPSRRFKRCVAKPIRASQARRRHKRLAGAIQQISIGIPEPLEDRLLLSAAPVIASLSAGGSEVIAPVGVSSSTGGGPNGSDGGSPVDYISPAELRAAYGINLVASQGLNGAGETIAIVDAYNDADIIPDANAFSTAYGLPGFNGAGQPTLTVLNEKGGTSLTGISSAKGTIDGSEWALEKSIDVEWAHAVAAGEHRPL